MRGEETRARFLEIVNNEMGFVSLLKAANKARRSWEAYYGRSKSPIEVYCDPKSRILQVTVDLSPRPWHATVYVVAQGKETDWYLSPSKVPSKATKVLKRYRKRPYPQVDAYTAIACERATEPARKLGAKLGAPVRKPEKVIEDWAKYFAARLDKLAKMKRLCRGDALTAWFMQLALEYLGYPSPKAFSSEEEAIKAALECLELQPASGPPAAG